MNKIVFDLTKTQQTSDGKFHGGGKYGIEVFKKMAEDSPSFLIAFYNNELYLDNIIKSLINEKGIKTYFCDEYNILEVARNEKAIIYSPLLDREYLLDKNIHILISIHGVRDLLVISDEYKYSYGKDKKLYKSFLAFVLTFFGKWYEEFLYKKAIQKYLLFLKSSNIDFVTVSNHSKYALLSFFPFLKTSDIKVFYSPSTIVNYEIDNNYKQIGKYWLIVSGNRWLKNAIRAIKAFDQLFEAKQSLEGKVIITGLKSLDDLGVKVCNRNRFICVGYIEENELKGLYKNAYAFIYPTLDEGFGYPPLEAMHEGCPVISSCVASIPEICGDAVMYFNPYSIKELIIRVLQMEEPEVRSEYVSKGYIRQREIENKQKKDLKNLSNYILSYMENH